VEDDSTHFTDDDTRPILTWHENYTEDPVILARRAKRGGQWGTWILTYLDPNDPEGEADTYECSACRLEDVDAAMEESRRHLKLIADQ